MRPILLVSNGYAEDLVGAALGRWIRRTRPEAAVAACPLVGEGSPYPAGGIPVRGPTRVLPSGGFARLSAAAFLQDLRAGWLALTAQQHRVLRQAASEGFLGVAVGDLYPVFLMATAGLAPVILVSTARSVYIRGHSHLERSLLRRWCHTVFCRDPATARELQAAGVNARYAGNPVMDLLPGVSETIPTLPGALPLALLPGSRADAPENLRALAEAVETLRRGGWAVEALVALADGLELTEVAKALPPGWHPDDPGRSRSRGEVAAYRAHEPESRFRFFRGRFRDVVESSRVVLGTAGTANEQAAGLGRPVVAVPGRRLQFTPSFARMQQRLLGGALYLAPDPAAAGAAVATILTDPARYQQMADAGRARMGAGGGIPEIARFAASLAAAG